MYSIRFHDVRKVTTKNTQKKTFLWYNKDGQKAGLNNASVVLEKYDWFYSLAIYIEAQ